MVPDHELLGPRDTLALVVFAPLWGLRRADGGSGRGAGDLALVRVHVHVGLTTAVGNPAEGADAATVRARGHVGGDVVALDAMPRGVVGNSEDGKVIFVNLGDIGGV